MTVFPLQYRLQLGNGDSWSVFIAPGIERFGERFAALLELPRDSCRHPHSIYLYPEGDAGMTGVIAENTPLQGFTRIQDPITQDWTYRISPGNTGDNDLELVKMQGILSDIFFHVVRTGGLILHGSLISHPAYNGLALLAPGGMGKSTCARRIPPPWSALSDDMILVIRDDTHGYLAHPLPTWSELYGRENPQKTWPLEFFIPLKRLFFLQRGEEDTILPLNKIEVPLLLFESAIQVLTWHLRNLPEKTQSPMKKLIFENSCEIARTIPAYVLKAIIDGHFWNEIEQNFIDQNNISITGERSE